MKGRYYRVGPAIWLEPWSDDARYVALYLLTCPHRTTEGIFRMPLEYAIADLGWPARRFNRAFDELQEHGFIAYDPAASVCLIEKALEWQSPENPNQVKAAMKLLASLPPTPLRDRFDAIADEHSKRLANEIRNESPEPLSKPSTDGSKESLSLVSQLTPLAPRKRGEPLDLDPPTGNRKTQRRAFGEKVNAVAAEVFPAAPQDQARRCVEQAAGQPGATTVDSIVEHAERWFPTIVPPNEETA